MKNTRIAMMLMGIAALGAPVWTVAQTSNTPHAELCAKGGGLLCYTPRAQFCADGSGKLCPVIPATIGRDPKTNSSQDYKGLFGPLPTTAADDVETPFDNMAWQMFVALNWATNASDQPPPSGLTASRPRVWQSYRKVSTLFGDSHGMASCSNPQGLPVFNIGSDGHGKPAPNNEEYFQASTNLPLIDINGNWTIYERRVNDIEANYLLSPNGQTADTLTTELGQDTFINDKTHQPDGVQFPASAVVPNGANGSIEIKAAWRIIDQAAGDDPSRYYTEKALLAVAGDLVRGGRQICSNVTMGLVGLHIIQRNLFNPDREALLPRWIWASFEHVDNAPIAQSPCTVELEGCGSNPWINTASCGAAKPAAQVRYSYFMQNAGIESTNIRPKALLQLDADRSEHPLKAEYPWNPRPPYARDATSKATAMPQATRCWQIYPTTQQLNTQWQQALKKQNSVLQNYMLIGTQWGASVISFGKTEVPTNAVPGMLSNITLETYIQNYTGSDPNSPGPGSCIGCHNFATLTPVRTLPPDKKISTPADFSFLPGLAQPETARSKIKTPN